MVAEYFCEWREVGVINVGSSGEIVVDCQTFKLNNRDGLYISRGNKDVTFKSDDGNKPA